MEIINKEKLMVSFTSVKEVKILKNCLGNLIEIYDDENIIYDKNSVLEIKKFLTELINE